MPLKYWFSLLLLACTPAWCANPVSPYRDLALGGDRPINQTIQVGHAKFSLDGRIATLQHDGRNYGLFFQGRGSLKYQSAFEPEKPVMKKNLAEMTPVKVSEAGEGNLVEVDFTSARFLASGIALPEGMAGEGSAPPTAPYKAHQDHFRGVQNYDPIQLLVFQLLNGGQRPILVAELSRAGQDWLYRYDSVQTHEEELSWLEPDKSGRIEIKGRLETIRISRQAIGWDIKKGPAPLDFIIRELDVDLRTKDNRQVQFVVKESLSIEANNVQCITFGLMNGFLTETDTRQLKVTRVSDESGKELPFEHINNRLLLNLGQPYARGSVLKLRFEYEGDFLYRPGGDTYWELGVREFWYPSSLPYDGELYTFHGTVRTTGEWISFLPGDTLRRQKDGDWNLVETRTEKPICFATILGGKYFVDDETRDGITIHLASYAFKVGVAKKPLLDQAFNVIRYYQSFLGPFPFKEFLIVEKNQWGYGQAPPGMMYITKEAFNQHMDWAQYFRLGIRKRYAHEIAHQYWGTVVKMPSPEDQWITEAFADYCAALYERDYKGQGQFDQSASYWKSNAKDVTDKAPIPLANDLHIKSDYDNMMNRTNLLYSKGPNLLLALHQELGDTQFLIFLKSLQTNFRWRFLSTARVADFLKFMTKRDYTDFLNHYYWGLEIPPTK